MADLGVNARDAPSGLKFLHFHAVFEKILAKYQISAPLELAPPPLGYTGSASGNRFRISQKQTISPEEAYQQTI